VPEGTDHTSGWGQLYFSATCGTVNPFSRSLFSEFAHVSILTKWLDMTYYRRPNRFVILSCGILFRFMRRVFRSISKSVPGIINKTETGPKNLCHRFTNRGQSVYRNSSPTGQINAPKCLRGVVFKRFSSILLKYVSYLRDLFFAGMYFSYS